MLVHNEWRGTFEEFEEAVEFGELDLFLNIDVERAKREAASGLAVGPAVANGKKEEEKQGEGSAVTRAPKDESVRKTSTTTTSTPVQGAPRLAGPIAPSAGAAGPSIPLAPAGSGERKEADAERFLASLGIEDLDLTEEEISEILEAGKENNSDMSKPTEESSQEKAAEEKSQKYPGTLGLGNSKGGPVVPRTYIPSAEAGTKPLRLAKMGGGSGSGGDRRAPSVTSPRQRIESEGSKGSPVHARYNPASTSSKALAAEAQASVTSRAFSSQRLREAVSRGDDLKAAMSTTRTASGTDAKETVVGREDLDSLMASLGLGDNIKMTDEEAEAFLLDGTVPLGLGTGGDRLMRAGSVADKARSEAAARDVARRAKEKGYGSQRQSRASLTSLDVEDISPGEQNEATGDSSIVVKEEEEAEEEPPLQKEIAKVTAEDKEEEGGGPEVTMKEDDTKKAKEEEEERLRLEAEVKAVQVKAKEEEEEAEIARMTKKKEEDEEDAARKRKEEEEARVRKEKAEEEEAARKEQEEKATREAEERARREAEERSKKAEEEEEERREREEKEQRTRQREEEEKRQAREEESTPRAALVSLPTVDESTEQPSTAGASGRESAVLASTASDAPAKPATATADANVRRSIASSSSASSRSSSSVASPAVPPPLDMEAAAAIKPVAASAIGEEGSGDEQDSKDASLSPSASSVRSPPRSPGNALQRQQPSSAKLSPQTSRSSSASNNLRHQTSFGERSPAKGRRRAMDVPRRQASNGSMGQSPSPHARAGESSFDHGNGPASLMSPSSSSDRMSQSSPVKSPNAKKKFSIPKPFSSQRNKDKDKDKTGPSSPSSSGAIPSARSEKTLSMILREADEAMRELDEGGPGDDDDDYADLLRGGDGDDFSVNEFALDDDDEGAEAK